MSDKPNSLPPEEQWEQFIARRKLSDDTGEEVKTLKEELKDPNSEIRRAADAQMKELSRPRSDPRNSLTDTGVKCHCGGRRMLAKRYSPDPSRQRVYGDPPPKICTKTEYCETCRALYLPRD